jgi:hypothetical protein
VVDFIEQWFGLSPDHGDGSTEVMYLGVLVVILGLILGRRHILAMVRKWRV